MSTLIDTAAITRGTRSLFDLLTPEQIDQIRHLRRDAELESRIGELAERANEGLLTPEETAEYHGYVEANSVLAVLRSIARRKPQAN